MSVLVQRVVLKNYKSIGKCDVRLRDLTLMVGPNGAGKSNFVDALRLVKESLSSTLEYGIRNRGGIGEVRRRSSGHPNHFAISLRLRLASGVSATFAFQIGAQPNGAFVVQREQAAVGAGSSIGGSYFELEQGRVRRSNPKLTLDRGFIPDRLYLPVLSGVPPFNELFDALTGMTFYNVNPAAIRELQAHDRGEELQRDGGNIAAVLKRLEEENAQAFSRIQAYLRQIIPGIESVSHKQLGPKETIEFRQKVQKSRNPWKFYASSMSDGTLRSLGVLVALFQYFGRGVGRSKQNPFIAIEEPESTIHPGAAGILMDALLESSRKLQVVSTTHSPDLLDHKQIDSDSIVAVRNVDGETLIAPADQASRSAIRDDLYTPGELLRKNQIQPDVTEAARSINQQDLFERAL